MSKPSSNFHLPSNEDLPQPSSNFHLLTSKTPRVAIVHDWLIGGGAELVVEQLHQMYPEAPIYTSYTTAEWRERLDNKVVTGYLQRWPFSKLRKFIPPLRALWFEHLDLSGFDLVISSSGAEAKYIRLLSSNSHLPTPKAPLHVAYIHAPTHYYWSRYDEYMKYPGFGQLDPLARLGLKLLVGPMRDWDYKAAQRPHYIIANSTHIQKEIKKYYGRDSVVIHPPVDVARFQLPSSNYQLPQNRSGFVITGRQTPYKRFDLAVEACTSLSLPLKVLGTGPDNAKLKKIAGPTISFLDWVPYEDVPKHLAEAVAFIFPGLDDFGISAVEALATGTPVIAFKAGGALDYVVPGKTGEFFSEQSAESLIKALKSFKALTYNQDAIRNVANKFSKEHFREKVTDLVDRINHKQSD